MYLEDLQVAILVRNRPLAKSIGEARWSQFRDTLAHEEECFGKQVVLVAPAHTSQDCSARGERVTKRLSARTHFRPSCRYIADRDQHVALIICRAGQPRRGAVAEAAVLRRASRDLSR